MTETREPYTTDEIVNESNIGLILARCERLERERDEALAWIAELQCKWDEARYWARRMKHERDDAREWARNLLLRCELEHWLTMRIGSYGKEDEQTIKTLTNERDALKVENERLREANQWIPCSERMPIDIGAVLAWRVDPHCNVQFVDIYSYDRDDGDCWYDVHGNKISRSDITHWRPLPEPP